METSSDIQFSVPYEIAAIRPLRQTTVQERQDVLEAAHYNTELIPQDTIYVDLKTDGGVSSLSTSQLAKLHSPFEAPIEMAAEGNKAFITLSENFHNTFGFPFMVPCTQGRAAERILTKLYVKAGTVVPGNMLFPSTRFHIVSNGAEVVDVTGETAHELFSNDLFKGNVDLEKLQAVFKEHGPNGVSCIYVELAVNSCGGHPVSLENLKSVRAIASAHRVPLFLDACRILENSCLIRQREPGYQNRTILEIVHETCSLADGMTLSALKDFLVPVGGFIGIRDEGTFQKASLQNFLNGSQAPSVAMEMVNAALTEVFDSEAYVASRVEQVAYLWRRLQGRIPILTPPAAHAVFVDARSFVPHIPPEEHPADALAAFIYRISGIRITKGPPLAPSQTARGFEFLRLALPPRRYLQAHMDDVADAILFAYSRRHEIGGLRREDKPGRSKYDLPVFVRITNETVRAPESSSDRHLGAVFFRLVHQLGNRTFVKLQRGDRLEEISWQNFGRQVKGAILGLYSLGLQKGERVGIVGENSVGWLCADIATLAGGFPNVVMSPMLSDRLLLKILAHSDCRAAFVGDAVTATRLLHLKSQLPSLSTIILMDDSAAARADTLTLAELISRGLSRYDERYLQAILNAIDPVDLATIMYTSGSTGEPKGVMRTQANLLLNISNGRELVLSKPDELTVLILSLNHLFGRFGFLKSSVTGRTTAVIEATERAVNLKDIESLAPTAMALVPRVMEKIWNTILDEAGDREAWGRLEALDRIKAETGYLRAHEEEIFADLKRRLREAFQRALGGRIKYISYGGAPMQPRIMRFFELIEIPLLGCYGTTECGGVTLSGIGPMKPGSLGKPLPNVELRIADDGEILVRGPTVTPGYFRDPERTREAIDPDGWFHTGDLGSIDSEDCLFVVGRKKDVFNCSDGSNIYPSHIEIPLENDPFIRQVILVGDQRPFIAALILPDTASIRAKLKKPETALSDHDIRAVIQCSVDELNARLEAYEKIRKFIVVKTDFPAQVRSVTANQKTRVDRKAVDELYAKEISQIYSESLTAAST